MLKIPACANVSGFHKSGHIYHALEWTDISLRHSTKLLQYFDESTALYKRLRSVVGFSLDILAYFKGSLNNSNEIFHCYTYIRLMHEQLTSPQMHSLFCYWLRNFDR